MFVYFLFKYIGKKRTVAFHISSDFALVGTRDRGHTRTVTKSRWWRKGNLMEADNATLKLHIH